MLGLTAILALVLVPPLGLGITWLGWHLTGPELAATLPRLGALVLVYAAYFLTVLGAAAAVSTLSRSARGALMALLGFWLVNGCLAPRAAAEVARHLAPAASPAVFARELEAAVARHEEGSGGAAARGLQVIEDESNRRFDALYVRWETSSSARSVASSRPRSSRRASRFASCRWRWRARTTPTTGTSRPRPSGTGARWSAR